MPKLTDLGMRCVGAAADPSAMRILGVVAPTLAILLALAAPAGAPASSDATSVTLLGQGLGVARMAEPKVVATRAVGPLRRIVADLGPFQVVDASGSDRGWRLGFGVEAASADGGALPRGSTSFRLPPCRAADYRNGAVPPVVRPGYAPVDEGTLQVASARPGTGGGAWTCGTEGDGGRLEMVLPAPSGRVEVTLTTTIAAGP